jgi:hypothetical protein
MKHVRVLFFLLATTTVMSAQVVQQPDPALLEKAFNAASAQRNSAFDAAAGWRQGDANERGT